MSTVYVPRNGTAKAKGMCISSLGCHFKLRARWVNRGSRTTETETEKQKKEMGETEKVDFKTDFPTYKPFES